MNVVSSNIRSEIGAMAGAINTTNTILDLGSYNQAREEKRKIVRIVKISVTLIPLKMMQSTSLKDPDIHIAMYFLYAMK